ncbi:MAG TPA: type II toxin-antitoxin system PemK/MazF family toxin [Allosphingosinicella sp.]|jgi:uncharacterized protein YifN (PemK superfamily)
MKPSTPSGTPKFPTKPGRSTTSWTIPKPTDVLSYVYLWSHEAAEGRDEGTKERPVVVVLAVQQRDHGTEIIVAPVTTKPPRQRGIAVEIPARVREHLRLGAEPCWIVCDELNRFTWPGPDVRLVQGRGELTPFHGKIPGRLLEQVRDAMRIAVDADRLKLTKRTE